MCIYYYYNYFKKSNSTDTFTNMIPKNIYLYDKKLQTYMNIDYSEKWHTFNPEYKIYKYDFIMYKKLIQTKFPNIYYQTLLQIKDLQLKADFIKLCILYHYGGIFIDIDLEPLYPLDTYIKSTFVICKSMQEDSKNQYSTKFIACKKHIPILKNILHNYFDHTLAGKSIFYSPNWNLSTLFTNMLSITDSEIKTGIYKLIDDTEVQIIEQQSSQFFYDACYCWEKKRIMNDKQPYFHPNDVKHIFL